MNYSNKRKLKKNRFNKPTAEQKSNLSKFNLDYALKKITIVSKFSGFIHALHGCYYFIAHHNDIIDKIRMALENSPF